MDRRSQVLAHVYMYNMSLKLGRGSSQFTNWLLGESLHYWSLGR